MDGKGATCSPKGPYAFIAVAALTVLVWASLLSVSPSLHEQVHPDANRLDHHCIVTLVASGHAHHSPAVPLVDSYVFRSNFGTVPQLNPSWVQSLFLSASIFEHAPPPWA